MIYESPLPRTTWAYPIHAAKLARNTDPNTSHDAAKTVHEFAGKQHDLILKVFQKHGAMGLTAHDVALFCDLDAHAIGKRMNELEKDLRIKVQIVGGVTITRKTPSGRNARVWVLNKD